MRIEPKYCRPVVVFVHLDETELKYMTPSEDLGWVQYHDVCALKTCNALELIKECESEIRDWEEAYPDHDYLPDFEGYALWCELRNKLVEIEQNISAICDKFAPPIAKPEPIYDPFPEAVNA